MTEVEERRSIDSLFDTGDNHVQQQKVIYKTDGGCSWGYILGVLLYIIFLVLVLSVLMKYARRSGIRSLSEWTFAMVAVLFIFIVLVPLISGTVAAFTNKSSKSN